MDDESHFNTLIRVFDQALEVIRALDPEQRAALARRPRRYGEMHIFGVGVLRMMGNLMAEYGLAET